MRCHTLHLTRRHRCAAYADLPSDKGRLGFRAAVTADNSLTGAKPRIFSEYWVQGSPLLKPTAGFTSDYVLRASALEFAILIGVPLANASTASTVSA